jgi:hypothetical protein
MAERYRERFHWRRANALGLINGLAADSASANGKLLYIVNVRAILRTPQLHKNVEGDAAMPGR